MIVSTISPFRDSRDEARKRFGGKFIEVYLNCSYEECKKRDVKGIYIKAENGEIENFIGLHIPYEPPLVPEVEIFSARESPKIALEKIIQFLKLRFTISY